MIMRPRILYVDRDQPGSCHQCRMDTLRVLRRDYEVEALVDLTPHVVDVVQDAEKRGRPYAAIVTHFPPNEAWDGVYPYQQSLNIVAAITESTEAPVIANTGAALGDIQPAAGFFEGIVQGNHAKLLELVARAVAHPRRPEVVVPPPVVLQCDGRATVEARVNLWKGIAYHSAHQILRLCAKFSGDATLQKSEGDPDEIANAKDFMSLGLLGAGEGERVVFSVVGTSAEAETLARQFYAIVTARFYWDVDLDRFAAPEKTT